MDQTGTPSKEQNGVGNQNDKPAGRDGAAKVREIGGPKGPEPTRYGDWEKGGRCTDF